MRSEPYVARLYWSTGFTIISNSTNNTEIMIINMKYIIKNNI